MCREIFPFDHKKTDFRYDFYKSLYFIACSQIYFLSEKVNFGWNSLRYHCYKAVCILIISNSLHSENFISIIFQFPWIDAFEIITSQNNRSFGKKLRNNLFFYFNWLRVELFLLTHDSLNIISNYQTKFVRLPNGNYFIFLLSFLLLHFKSFHIDFTTEKIIIE